MEILLKSKLIKFILKKGFIIFTWRIAYYKYNKKLLKSNNCKYLIWYITKYYKVFF